MFRLKKQHLSIALLHKHYVRRLSALQSLGIIDNYQFLQKSVLPTTYFQPSLPRLPIPELRRTCDRFLMAVQPLSTPDEYTYIRNLVEDFHHNQGMHLNALLKQEDAAQKHTSYISGPWFEMYLRDRNPLPLNYNPLLVMKNHPEKKHENRLVRASNLIISSLRFWRSLQSELLEPEIFHLNPQKSDTERFRRIMRLTPTIIASYAAYAFKAFPLDMSQYSRLFGVSRIPQLGIDQLVQHQDSKHIIVMRGGNIYSMKVINDSGEIEPAKLIFERLRAIEKLDKELKPAEVPIGVLTTNNRDEWANARDHLINCISRNNKELLNEIDAALFCLCLDTDDDPIYNEDNPVPVLKHFLASDGRNRWFDKSISLLIGSDGTVAINFEHSWGDGVAVLRFFNEVYKETQQHSFLSNDIVENTNSNSDLTEVRHIKFDFDQHLKDLVTTAYEKNAKIFNSLDMNILRYPHLNKKFCKKFSISPDSIMQLSFQLAYRKAFENYVGTYESCSTAAFRHGRTEAMRPCTIATKNFCEALMLPTTKRPDNAILKKMIENCSHLHVQLTKEAAMGQGFDRHLFALKDIALRNNLSVHGLYESDIYKRINYNILSTSTLSSDALLAGAFGPVVKDGLGIGYSIQNEECGAVVSSYRNQRDGAVFIEHLKNAFNDIRNIINQAS